MSDRTIFFHVTLHVTQKIAPFRLHHTVASLKYTFLTLTILVYAIQIHCGYINYDFTKAAFIQNRWILQSIRNNVHNIVFIPYICYFHKSANNNIYP